MYINFFIFLLFLVPLSSLSQYNLKNTIYMYSLETENVASRKEICLNVKKLDLKSNNLDSLLNLQKTCLHVYNKLHKFSHVELRFSNDSETIYITINEGAPNDIEDIFGVFINNDIPYLVYLNSYINELFTVKNDTIQIIFEYLYDKNNNDITNELFLLDDLKQSIGMIKLNNKEFNYYLETCY